MSTPLHTGPHSPISRLGRGLRARHVSAVLRCLLFLAITGSLLGVSAQQTPNQTSTASAASGAPAKPAPSPQPPVAQVRPSGFGGSLNGATRPAHGSSPAVLHRASATAIQALAGKPAQPASPAPNMPAHGTLVGQPPMPKGSTAAATRSPSVVNKPLLIPAPSGHSPPGGQYPANLYGSTQVDNGTACGSAVNETTIAQSNTNPNLLVAGANTYQNSDGTCGDSHAFATTRMMVASTGGRPSCPT